MLILLPQLFLDSPPPPYPPNFMSFTIFLYKQKNQK